MRLAELHQADRACQRQGIAGHRAWHDPGDQRALQMEKSLIEIAIESWRFSRLFVRLLAKLDAGESARYLNQYRYYLKKLDESLETSGMRIVNVEGQLYDPGVAASALNIGDFGPDDHLYVDQMIEPILMGQEGLIRPGTIMLKKVDV